MVYQGKRIYTYGGRTYSVPAQKVGEHFEKLEEEFGAVTRENFLESATPEDSPFHKLFEWNNDKAANLYRLQQSNQIINAVCVKIETESGETREVNAFVNTEKRGNGEAKYINLQKCMEKEETRKTALENAKLELGWFRAKYKNYQWYLSIKEPIDQFLESAT